MQIAAGTAALYPIAAPILCHRETTVQKHHRLAEERNTLAALAVATSAESNSLA